MGKDNFPIVNQSYYPNHHELVSQCNNNAIKKIEKDSIKLHLLRQSCSPKFPCVFKVGHAHGGQGKVKVDNEARYLKMRLPTAS